MTQLALSTGRRRFIAGAGGALASGLAIPRGLAAQSVAPRRIDVHNHLNPPPYLEAARSQIMAVTDTDPTPVLSWNPVHAIQEMDGSGVAVAMLSMLGPPISSLGGTRDQWRKLTRACNEYAASLLGDYPSRFGNFAAVPLPDVEGSISESAYALDVLKADGIGIFTSYGSQYPGDPAFRPFFAELNQRKAVVFVHPNSPKCCATSVPGIPPSLDEFMFDVTRAITSMLFGGTFATFPDIRFIFTHAGGTIMPISGRISAFGARHHEYSAAVPHGANYELAKLHYDIANSTNPSAMSALMNLVPTTQILFGSDTPFVPIVASATGLDSMVLPLDVRTAINHGNALRLFPRFSQ